MEIGFSSACPPPNSDTLHVTQYSCIHTDFLSTSFLITCVCNARAKFPRSRKWLVFQRSRTQKWSFHSPLAWTDFQRETLKKKKKRKRLKSLFDLCEMRHRRFLNLWPWAPVGPLCKVCGTTATDVLTPTNYISIPSGRCRCANRRWFPNLWPVDHDGSSSTLQLTAQLVDSVVQFVLLLNWIWNNHVF